MVNGFLPSFIFHPSLFLIPSAPLTSLSSSLPPFFPLPFFPRFSSFPFASSISLLSSPSSLNYFLPVCSSHFTFPPLPYSFITHSLLSLPLPSSSSSLYTSQYFFPFPFLFLSPSLLLSTTFHTTLVFSLLLSLSSPILFSAGLHCIPSAIVLSNKLILLFFRYLII